VTEFVGPPFDVSGLAHLVPTWCHRVAFKAAPEGDHLADCWASYRARCAEVTLYPAFFAADDKTQRDTIAHEFVHILIWPLSQYAENLEGPPEDDELDARTEAVTEDIRHAFAEGSAA
jgi:hypothetical protein